jgi:hypothetical protein
MPIAYSVFRFSTAFATFLLMLTFAANALVPRISFGAAAPAPAAQEAFGVGGGCEGCGGGNGGGEDTEAPAATEAPMAEAPSVEMAVAPTEVLPAASADSAREIGTPTAEVLTAKEPAIEPAPQDQPKVHAEREVVFPLTWQIGLLVAGLVSAVIAFAMNQNAKKKWR